MTKPTNKSLTKKSSWLAKTLKADKCAKKSNFFVFYLTFNPVSILKKSFALVT